MEKQVVACTQISLVYQFCEAYASVFFTTWKYTHTGQ